jgi:hypothetical protein
LNNLNKRKTGHSEIGDIFANEICKQLGIQKMKATFISILVLLLFSCDNMIQYIDVEPANFSPRLAVSATINTDDGVFSICFAEARSLGSYKDWRAEEQTIIRKGSISLYEDEQLVFRQESEGEGFDMSLGSSRSGYATGVRGLHFTAGTAYRLALEIDGYPTASATVTMPDAPIIEHISVDTLQLVTKKNPYWVEQLGSGGYGVMMMCPLTVRLTDNSTERDYYMVQRIDRTDGYSDGRPMGGDAENAIGITNTALIQDNPDMEAAQIFLGGDETDVYLFKRMLLSDMSFANATGTLDLWISNTFYHKYPCDYPDRRVFSDILVSHLSTATFAHYRSLVLQSAGVGFFSEPVSIAGNIENGYGCFAAINTVRTTVARYNICDNPYY